MAKKQKPELAVDNEDDDSLQGHNSNNGEFNEALKSMFEEYEEIDENKKQMAKAQRDIRAKAKEQFGIQASVFSHEIRCRKMDNDVRIQFEQAHEDLKNMLGYQYALDGVIPEEGDIDEENDPESVASRKAKK